ncbi:Origin of replication complex subunit 6 [Coemansia sp. RSA 2607]|nr:Origin of replication complex subunit 6 [Coemansia sp. RSA 2607]
MLLCRQAVAIQLACETLSIEFNEVAASSMSAVSSRTYLACVQEARVALGLNKNITLEELDVQFGPPRGVVAACRDMLVEFKVKLVGTMPPSVSRSINWNDSVYIVGVFSVVCKYMKKRIAGKTKLLALSSVKALAFNNAVAKFESICKDTIKKIEDGVYSETAKTPSRRRTMAAITPLNEQDDEIQQKPKAPAPRGRRATMAPGQIAAAAAASVSATDQMDEVASIVTQKRGQKVVEPASTVSKPKRGRPSMARKQTEASDTESQTKTVKRQRLGTAQSKTKSIASKAASAVRKIAQKKSEQAAARRPRIGIVSMVQDRDYRETPLYANYQTWRSAIMSAQ